SIVLVVPLGAIPLSALCDLACVETEEEEVLFPSLCRHLDRSAVACSNRQGSIHHEFHVACAAGFISGSRNLVGNITGGDQSLGEGNAVIRKKHDFEPASYCRITGYASSHIVDELYD